MDNPAAKKQTRQDADLRKSYDTAQAHETLQATVGKLDVVSAFREEEY
jgi:hypothetical protein